MDEENNKKILKIQKEFDKEYEKYINGIKMNNNLYFDNYDDTNKIKRQNDIVLNEYKKEMIEE